MAWEGSADAKYNGPTGEPLPDKFKYNQNEWGGGHWVQRDEFGNEIGSQSGADADVERYRTIGDRNQPAGMGPKIDQRQQQETRGAQQRAFDLSDRTARGVGRSAAVDLVDSQTRRTQAAQRSLAAGTRGGVMARTAAMRNAQRANAVAGATGAAQARAVRAQEMANARGESMGIATDMREQDLGVARDQSALDQKERERIAQNEAFYERLAWDTRNAQLGANLGRSAQEQANALAGRQAQLRDDQASWDMTKTIAGVGTGAVQGGIQGYQAGGGGGGSSGGGSGDIIRENPYSDSRTKKVVPYGSLAGLMTSDPAAKREAYLLGRAHQNEFAKTGKADFEFQPKEGEDIVDKSVSREPKKEPLVTKNEAKAIAKTIGLHGLMGGAAPLVLGPSEAVKAALDDVKEERQPPPQQAPSPAKEPPPAIAQPTATDRAKTFAGSLAPMLMRSDMTTKDPLDLYDPRTRQTPEGRGFTASDAPADDGGIPRASLSGRASVAKQAPAQQPAQKAKKASRRMTADEAAAELDKLAAYNRPREAASLARGPSTRGHIPDDAMRQAMKSMEPSIYSYKDQFRPSEQAPGELQAGPMADKMERDPIAGMAIKREPGTGLRAIDKDKALKLTMGSLAVLANDVESLKRRKRSGA